jgi:Flp pilus assembly protein, pilin Flp
MNLKQKIMDFFKDEQGASAIEYALIAVMVAVVIAGFIPGIKPAITKVFTDIQAAFPT